VSCAGLVPVMALAARCGLETLLGGRLTMAGKGTANAAGKVLALVTGMISGADSINDMDLLRHGGMTRLFDRVRPGRAASSSSVCRSARGVRSSCPASATNPRSRSSACGSRSSSAFIVVPARRSRRGPRATRACGSDPAR